MTEVRVDPNQVRVTGNEGDYTLLLGCEPLLTPAGRPVAHSSRRLLEHIRRDLTTHDTLDVTRFGPYSIYCTQKDFVEEGQDMLAGHIEAALLADLVMYRVPGPEQVDQLKRWYFVLNYLEAAGCWLPALPMCPPEGTVVDDDVLAWLPDDLQSEMRRIAQVVGADYEDLPPERRALVINLFNIHHSGVLLPLMLVTGRCSGEEYAEAVIAAEAWLPHTFGDADWNEYGEALSSLRSDAYMAMEYAAHYYDESQNAIQRLIAGGESMTVEFKSSLRMNLHAQPVSKDPAMEHEVLKTIAAFLNTTGGSLLIGVDDAGGIVGIAVDSFKNRDAFERHLTTIIRERLRPLVTEVVRTSFERFGREEVCLV